MVEIPPILRLLLAIVGMEQLVIIQLIVIQLPVTLERPVGDLIGVLVALDMHMEALGPAPVVIPVQQVIPAPRLQGAMRCGILQQSLITPLLPTAIGGRIH